MHIYGYARVSSMDQNETRQVIALTRAGVGNDDIFIDKKSGNDFDRPQWKKIKRKLKRGDTVVVQSLDRLGRNYLEIIDEWGILVKRKGVNIHVLDMPILNTDNSDKGITATFISDLVLQILSYVAEVERNNIRERQRQGICAAKKRGVRFGRRKKAMPDDFFKFAKLVVSKQISLREAAKACNISVSTFRRRFIEFKKSNVLL